MCCTSRYTNVSSIAAANRLLQLRQLGDGTLGNFIMDKL